MDIDFEIKFLFGMYQVLQGPLFWLVVDMSTLSGYPLLQTKTFLILKSNISVNLCQLLQDFSLFLGLDMFFMVTRLWCRTKAIDFKTKFLFRMYQVLQIHLLWLEADMVTLSG